MLQPRRILGAGNQAGLVALSLALVIFPSAAVAQQHTGGVGSLVANESDQFPTESLITADLHIPQLQTSSILGAAMCFAVGFGACLLVVHSLLPSLVHAQCVKIVRDYLDHTRRESDIRVVVIDREPRDSLQQPRRVGVPVTETRAEPSYVSQPHRRVDTPTASFGSAPVARSGSRSGEDPDSMLSQIYEQNLHLRDQLRKQSRSVKQ